MIDTQTSTTSFTATPGLIDSGADILISDPTNFADNVLYTVNFVGAGKIPDQGFVKIDFPTDLVFTKDETLKLGSCFYLKCDWLSDTSLRL
jgi:hypothetical protein